MSYENSHPEWKALNKDLKKASLTQLLYMLTSELNRDKPRPSYIKRIHGKLTQLRRKKELKEMGV